MADEFDTNLEDGSAERVGKDVVKLWNAIHGSNLGEQEVTRLETLSNKQRGKKVVAEVQHNSDEDEDEDVDVDDSGEEWTDDDDPPRLLQHQPKDPEQPEIDDDGFTLVKRKGKR